MKFVGSVWLKLSLVFLSTLASPELSGGIGGEGPREIPLEHVINADICNMCLRMLHHLLVRSGYLQIGSKELVVAEVVGKMLEIWKNLVSFAVMHPNHILMTQIFKYINRMAKFSSEAQEDHPKGFMRYVRPYLEFACTQIIDFVPDKVPDKYIIHNMIFLRAVVDKRKDAATNSDLYNATSSIFTRMFFSKLTAAMVANFFPTTISDMKLWEQKPEAFVSEERRCPWRHSRKACAEVLFGSSIRNYPATVCPVILEFFQGLVKEENSLQGREVPMEHIQKKDAVYYAVGLASEDIAAKLPFEKLLVTYLLPDLKNPDTRYRIIRHRIAFIIECWARHIQSLRKPTLVQAVYEVLCTLMADEDLAVRLSATCAFRVMVDDQDFRLEDFSRFIEISIELICRLVPTIAEVESNMQVIKIVHAIIMRLQDHLDAYVPKLLECLTSLWRATEEDDDNAMLLKSNILRTLNLVIKVLGPKAVNYYNFFLETITNSTDLPATRSLTMLEDGLTLWVSLLRFVPYNPVLADVFPTISGILEFSGEEEYNIRRQILRIIEAYIFMGGAEFLTKNLPGVVTATAELVDCEDDYQHRAVMRIIEQLLIRFPKEVSYLLHPLYEKIFIFMLMDRDEKEEEAQQKQSGGEKEKEDDRRSVDASASEGMADNNPIALSHDDTDLQYYLTLLRLLATDADTFLTFLTRFSQSHSSQASSAGPTNPEIDLPTPVHYLYRFVEKLIAILGKTARTPEQDMTRYKRRQEIHFRRLVVIALSVLFASILPKFGFTENFGMSHEQLTELAGIQQRMICAVVNAASVMIKDIHELTVSDQGSQQPLVEIKLNLVEQARDSLEQFDPVTSVDVVQLFVGKINELASTYTLLSKEQIMASIDGFVLQKLSGQ